MFAVKAIIVVSDCYLTPILQFFQLYHGENKLILKLDDDVTLVFVASLQSMQH
jgi:hypothetical protein